MTTITKVVIYYDNNNLENESNSDCYDNHGDIFVIK